MDNILPNISVRRLFFSKPYNQSHYPFLTSSNFKDSERQSFPVSKNHVGLGPKLMEIVKRKLAYGSKILPLGRVGKMFKKSFDSKDGEKLLHTSRCYIYTTAGAIYGVLFVSNERVGFCSDKSLKTYSTTGKLLKFRYKVSIPLEKINGVGESMNLKRPSNKYAELVTVDDYRFWFLGFPNYKKTIGLLRQKIIHD